MLRITQRANRHNDGYWHWRVWLEGPPEELSNVKLVRYQLHPSFPQPLVTVTDQKTNFAFAATGWGEFQIFATVVNRDCRLQRLRHWLQLRDESTDKNLTDVSQDSTLVLGPVVYISSGLADAERAYVLRDALRKRGIDALNTDQDPLKSSFAETVGAMVARSSIAVVLVSDVASPWLHREIALINEHGVPIVPVILKRSGSSAQLPPTLDERQALVVDYRDDMTPIAEKIAQLAEQQGHQAETELLLADNSELEVIPESLGQTRPHIAKERKYFLPYLRIQLRRRQKLANGKILEINPWALQLFGLDRPPKRFAELVACLDDKDDRWIQELQGAVNEAMIGSAPTPVVAVFRAPRGGKMYQPVVNRVVSFEDGYHEFDVILAESVARHSGYAMDGGSSLGLEALATSLRLGYRFRLDLLEPAIAKTEIGLDETVRISETIQSIEREAQSRGAIDRSALLGAFASEGDRSALTAMFVKWDELHTPRLDGKLDVALESGDFNGVRSCLLAAKDINRQFMSLASRRFADLLGS
jgi:hypothetical protein